jgi:thiol-disulfide isomerase/thioredoxin
MVVSRKENFKTMTGTTGQRRSGLRLSSTAVRVVVICGVIILCGTLAFFVYNRNRPPRERTYAEFSSPASAALPAMPAATTTADLKTIDGASLRLANYAGKVVVLDLWATWCGPCRKEVPHLVQLSKEFKDRDVEVIGLTTEDPAAAAQKVRDFAKEFQISYTLGWAGSVGSTLMRDNTSIPQKFVITRDGRLMKRLIGFNQVTGTAELREAVEKALRLGSEEATADVKPAASVHADGVRRMTPEELHAAVGRGEAVVLDVRPEAQYKAGHIQGTIWIPDNEITTRFNELPRGKLIVTYCS